MKKFIDQHRGGFDNEMPSGDLWSKIDAELGPQESIERTVPIRWLWMTVASAACAVLLMGVFVFLQDVGTEVVAENPPTQAQQTIPSLSLSDISSELAEVEQYYISEVSLRTEELMQYAEAEEYLAEVELLKEEFESLKKEMGRGVDQYKIVEAMIQNYRLRLEILEALLEELEDNQFEPVNNSRYEA
ncbi:MAG: hypothetical protein MK081_13220 [Flavobacteriales bacterium]|nr:hypothetical protein [Flavobacteriales bacterium]